MTDETTPNWDAFREKVSTYLESHNRILREFRGSMDNANNFLELAKLASEKEPENTVSMLEQIKEIDLFGHLTRQHEAFQEVAGMLAPGSDDPAIRLQAEEFEDLDGQYEAMLEEAEAQMDLLETLLAQLRGNA